MVGKKDVSPSVISGICLTAKICAQPENTRTVNRQYDRFIEIGYRCRDFENMPSYCDSDLGPGQEFNRDVITSCGLPAPATAT